MSNAYQMTSDNVITKMLSILRSFANKYTYEQPDLLPDWHCTSLPSLPLQVVNPQDGSPLLFKAELSQVIWMAYSPGSCLWKPLAWLQTLISWATLESPYPLYDPSPKICSPRVVPAGNHIWAQSFIDLHKLFHYYKLYHWLKKGAVVSMGSISNIVYINIYLKADT